MRKLMGLVVIIFLVWLLGEDASGSVTEWTPVKVGYITFKLDMESIPNRSAVYGLDVGLPITIAKKVAGLQVALLATESERMSGLQIAPLGNKAGCAYGLQVALGGNIVEKMVGIQINAVANNFDYDKLDQGIFQSDIVGFQFAPVTNITTTIKGAQVGAFNFSRDLSGFQIGVVNRSGGAMKGVQIGLINWRGTLKGLQVGLINHIENREFLRTTPLINLSF